MILATAQFCRCGRRCLGALVLLEPVQTQVQLNTVSTTTMIYYVINMYFTVPQRGIRKGDPDK